MSQLRTALAVVAFLWIGSGMSFASERFDVGLMLGKTKTTDEGAVLQFEHATTLQATFA